MTPATRVAPDSARSWMPWLRAPSDATPKAAMESRRTNDKMPKMRIEPMTSDTPALSRRRTRAGPDDRRSDRERGVDAGMQEPEGERRGADAGAGVAGRGDH